MLKLFTLCIKNIKNTNKLLYGEKKTKLLYGAWLLGHPVYL